MTWPVQHSLARKRYGSEFQQYAVASKTLVVNRNSLALLGGGIGSAKYARGINTQPFSSERSIEN